jgi:hypothetical protein
MTIQTYLHSAFQDAGTIGSSVIRNRVFNRDAVTSTSWIRCPNSPWSALFKCESLITLNDLQTKRMTGTFEFDHFCNSKWLHRSFRDTFDHYSQIHEHHHFPIAKEYPWSESSCATFGKPFSALLFTTCVEIRNMKLVKVCRSEVIW